MKQVEELVIEPDPDMLSWYETNALMRHENTKLKSQLIDEETEGMTDRDKAGFILRIEAAAEDARIKIDEEIISELKGDK